MALTPERYQQAKTTVLEALERPASERAAWLVEACGDDHELKQEARRLLALHEEAPDSFLDAPILPGAADLVRGAASDAEGADDDREPDELPEQIGPYRPLQVLGEGGMGIVYEAEQSEPVNRRVALKVIKAGMDSKQVLARFDVERQALAVMDHPSIARVLDVGQTEDGRPFFAMELVRGLPINEYCDRARLTTRERVELLRPALQAIQHAHQKGVVHRDLKPSNVLVMEQEGKPVPKIIDFGIAKALGRSFTDKTLVTEIGQAIGTPAYMSPEQAEGSGLDIDTRTDVYSLGVMLHELLSGRLPHEREGSAARYLSKLAAGEAEPPTPSSQVSTLVGEKAETVCRCRRSTVESLSRELRGDLDWIVLKAMDADRSRRYETVNALDSELRRYRANEPVMARPPTFRYRMGKFARRNRGSVTAAALLLLMLVSFSGVVSLQSVALVRQRDEARSQAETAKQVSGFLVELFEVSDPSESRGETLTARAILDRGAEKLAEDEGLADQPVVRARLLMTMGKVHRQLGSYERAEGLLRESLETWPLEQTASRSEHAECKAALGGVLSDLGRYDEAKTSYQAAIDTTEELGDPGGNLGAMLNNLGELLRLQGDYETAREVLERAHRIAEESFGPDHPDTAATHANLGSLLFTIGDPEGARSRFERALEILEEVHDEEHPALAGVVANLAIVHRNLYEHEAALRASERSLRILEKALGPDHPQVASVLLTIAATHRDLDEHEAALPHFERALSIQQKALGEHHPDVANTLASLAALRYYTDDRAAARELLERALVIREKSLGPEHQEVAATLGWLGALDAGEGDHAAALPRFARALTIGEAILAPSHPEVSTWRRNLAKCLLETGDPEAALRLRERAVAIAEEANAKNPKSLVLALESLSQSHRLAGQLETTRDLLSRCVAICEQKLGADHETTEAYRVDLAAVLAELTQGSDTAN